MKKLVNIVLYVLAPLAVTTSASFTANAEPYLAQRYGQKCSACHTNITGGGKRTATGNNYAMGLTDTLISTNFANLLGKSISIGANFRGDWSYTQFDDPEAVQGAVVAPQAPEDTSSFSISNGTLYFEFSLSEKLSFYLDQQVAPEGGRTREALVLYKSIFSMHDYIKVGKFFLPFGLRLQDDEAFIRALTGFNFDNSDIGFEYGYEDGAWSISGALSNGTQGAGENNRDKQASIITNFIKPTYRLGASVTNNNGINGLRQTGYSVFAGYTLGKWVLLGELDWFENDSDSGNAQQLISFLSVNFLYSPSVNIKLSYEYMDPDKDIDEDERIRVSLVGEKFLNQHVQLRLGARLYDGIPQNALQNQNIYFTELHVFF